MKNPQWEYIYVQIPFDTSITEVLRPHLHNGWEVINFTEVFAQKSPDILELRVTAWMKRKPA